MTTINDIDNKLNFYFYEDQMPIQENIDGYVDVIIDSNYNHNVRENKLSEDIGIVQLNDLGDVYFIDKDNNRELLIEQNSKLLLIKYKLQKGEYKCPGDYFNIDAWFVFPLQNAQKQLPSDHLKFKLIAGNGTIPNPSPGVIPTLGSYGCYKTKQIEKVPELHEFMIRFSEVFCHPIGVGTELYLKVIYYLPKEAIYNAIFAANDLMIQQDGYVEIAFNRPPVANINYGRTIELLNGVTL